MRVGLHALGIGDGARPEVIRAVATAAETHGFARLWCGEGSAGRPRNSQRSESPSPGVGGAPRSTSPRCAPSGPRTRPPSQGSSPASTRSGSIRSRCATVGYPSWSAATATPLCTARQRSSTAGTASTSRRPTSRRASPFSPIRARATVALSHLLGLLPLGPALRRTPNRPVPVSATGTPSAAVETL